MTANAALYCLRSACLMGADAGRRPRSPSSVLPGIPERAHTPSMDVVTPSLLLGPRSGSMRRSKTEALLGRRRAPTTEPVDEQQRRSCGRMVHGRGPALIGALPACSVSFLTTTRPPPSNQLYRFGVLKRSATAGEYLGILAPDGDAHARVLMERWTHEYCAERSRFSSPISFCRVRLAELAIVVEGLALPNEFVAWITFDMLNMMFERVINDPDLNELATHIGYALFTGRPHPDPSAGYVPFFKQHTDMRASLRVLRRQMDDLDRQVAERRRRRRQRVLQWVRKMHDFSDAWNRRIVAPVFRALAAYCRGNRQRRSKIAQVVAHRQAERARRTMRPVMQAWRLVNGSARLAAAQDTIARLHDESQAMSTELTDLRLRLPFTDNAFRDLDGQLATEEATLTKVRAVRAALSGCVQRRQGYLDGIAQRCSDVLDLISTLSSHGGHPRCRWRCVLGSAETRSSPWGFHWALLRHLTGPTSLQMQNGLELLFNDLERSGALVVRQGRASGGRATPEIDAVVRAFFSGSSPLAMKSAMAWLVDAGCVAVVEQCGADQRRPSVVVGDVRECTGDVMAGVEDRVVRSWNATADRLSSPRAPGVHADHGDNDDDDDDDAVEALMRASEMSLRCELIVRIVARDRRAYDAVRGSATFQAVVSGLSTQGTEIGDALERWLPTLHDLFSSHCSLVTGRLDLPTFWVVALHFRLMGRSTPPAVIESVWPPASASVDLAGFVVLFVRLAQATYLHSNRYAHLGTRLDRFCRTRLAKPIAIGDKRATVLALDGRQRFRLKCLDARVRERVRAHHTILVALFAAFIGVRELNVSTSVEMTYDGFDSLARALVGDPTNDLFSFRRHDVQKVFTGALLREGAQTMLFYEFEFAMLALAAMYRKCPALAPLEARLDALVNDVVLRSLYIRHRIARPIVAARVKMAMTPLEDIIYDINRTGAPVL